MEKKHRNSQKRKYFEDAVYFVTCKTEDEYPYFKDDIFCDLFVENLQICKKLKGFYLYGWVLAYNHFHLLVRPNDKFNISKVMFSIKKQFSHNVNRVVGCNTVPEGAQALARLRRINNYHLSAEYNKLDNYIFELKTQFHKNHPNQSPHPKFHWQKSYHDHYIRNDSDFDYHMDYMIWNPDKHKMPNNWPYVFTNSDYGNLIDECI